MRQSVPLAESFKFVLLFEKNLNSQDMNVQTHLFLFRTAQKAVQNLDLKIHAWLQR